jgi:glucosamine--fructose-6-phosphate aminotransferase (isomerizing)
MNSIMRQTMEGQPDDLRRLSADTGRIDELAGRLAGRRVFVIGTGTSWHAAAQGAQLLRLAGTDAWAMPSADFHLDGPPVGPEDAIVAMTHTAAKSYTSEALKRARAAGPSTVVISGLGIEGADLETVPREKSSAYTSSHLCALFRLAQIARSLGADLDLAPVPDAVAAALGDTPPLVDAPARLLEFIGGGINQWTAAEAALKVREAAYVATEGLGVEQFLHGPSVALRSTDTLVCFDGGGPWTERLNEVATAAEQSGVRVEVITAAPELGEPLSIFPLTVMAQRIALSLAESTGTNPDSFGRDVPGRESWAAIQL